ncbi:MAG: hypothetical protein ACRDRJ_12280 [Streptosporangiaceae bacterium]
MSWFWLNVPLMAVFFLATAGIPMWLVLRHPENGPARTSRSVRLDATPQSVPVIVVSSAAADRELIRA